MTATRMWPSPSISSRSLFCMATATGRFPRAELLESPNPRITSRAVTAADFDGDGRQDLAFVAEVDYDITSSAHFEGAVTAWVLFNRGGSWQLHNEGLPNQFDRGQHQRRRCGRRRPAGARPLLQLQRRAPARLFARR